jgi:hypothetical protein
VSTKPSDHLNARYCAYLVSPSFVEKVRNNTNDPCVLEFKQVEASCRIFIFLSEVSESDRNYLAGGALYNIYVPVETVQKVLRTVFENHKLCNFHRFFSFCMIYSSSYISDEFIPCIVCTILNIIS